METGSPNTTYTDITEHINETVVTDKDGWGEFRCQAGSVSVWVRSWLNWCRSDNLKGWGSKK
jgi:alpha-amylase